MGHAGVTTVAETKLHATRTIITHPPYKAPDRIHAQDCDDVPRKKKAFWHVFLFLGPASLFALKEFTESRDTS